MSWEGDNSDTDLKKAAVVGYPALGHRAEKNNPELSLSKKISGNLTTVKVKALDFCSLKLPLQKHSLVLSYFIGNQSFCRIKPPE